MDSWRNYRTVIEEPDASVSIDKFAKRYDRFEEQWEGFKWLVARNPEGISFRMSYNNFEYRLAHRTGDMSLGLPDIAVVYGFDENTVQIIDVSAWEIDTECSPDEQD